MFWHYDILTIFKYALVSEAGDIVTAVVDSNDKPIWSSALKALIVLPTKSESTFAVTFLLIVVLPIGVAFCFTFNVISALTLELPEK